MLQLRLSDQFNCINRCLLSYRFDSSYTLIMLLLNFEHLPAIKCYILQYENMEDLAFQNWPTPQTIYPTFTFRTVWCTCVRVWYASLFAVIAVDYFVKACLLFCRWYINTFSWSYIIYKHKHQHSAALNISEAIVGNGCKINIQIK